MAVDLAAFIYSPKGYLFNKKNKVVGPIAFNPKAYYLIIRLPTWKFFYRLLLLAILAASFLLISSSFVSRNPYDNSDSPSSNIFPQQSNAFDLITMDQQLTLLFNDLTNEGLIKKTHQHKAIFLGDIQQEQDGFPFKVFTDYNMEYIHINDMNKQSSIAGDSVDFIFTHDFPASSQFVDRALKTNSVATVLLLDAAFEKPSNYKVAYMRKFEKVVMAMKKTGHSTSEMKLGAQRKLCGYLPEAKKAALQKFENVLLEPPRASSGKSKVYLKKTKYLPDLMGDTLESYPRRVFIDVGLPEKEGGSGTEWFRKNYPTRNKNFEMYKIETVAEGSTQVEMSDWLRKNVKEEEYVVMKAESEVVEEMMRSKAIMLVDELFLECKLHRSNLKQVNRGRRAYWECLALYGKLRDTGVAVHQWWG